MEHILVHDTLGTCLENANMMPAVDRGAVGGLHSVTVEIPGKAETVVVFFSSMKRLECSRVVVPPHLSTR